MDVAQLMNDETAWWAKVRHARDHARRLRAEHRAYLARKPFSVVGEPTGDTETEIAYRFVQTEAIPSVLSLIVGDVLHCLRSGLDSLAFGIVADECGGRISPASERLCIFPIAATPESFDNHFEGRHRKRGTIMNARVRDSIRVAQPFYLRELLKEAATDTRSEVAHNPNPLDNPLWQIRLLNDLDKHRRLTAAAVWPGLRYFTHDGNAQYQLIPAGQPPWRDGDIVGHLHGTGPRPVHVNHEVHIALQDVSRWYESRRDLPDVVDGWVETVDRTLWKVIDAYARLAPAPTMSP